jgi:protein involved in polysaccharide export with SLBB domain
MSKLRVVLFAAAVIAAIVRVGAAQVPGAELNQVLVSRQALQDLLTRLDQAANSRNFSGEVRNRARAQGVLVRQRLQEGDFQVGDRILLHVEAESLGTDTFSVRTGRNLQLPVVGEISLQGVLRVELTDYLTQKLGQFFRNPKVRAQSLIRVAVFGGVGRQGFYTVPVDIPINDVLVAAGGVAPLAELNKFRIERGRERLFEGEYLQQVVAEGRTLDALGIRAGDRFVVPVQVQRNSFQTVQTVMFALQIPFSLYTLVKLLGL